MNVIPDGSGIYRIVCIANAKFYIGSAVNLRRRRGDHFQKLRRGLHPNRKLQHAWNAHGEQSFVFEVMELVFPPFLLEREQELIDLHKPFGMRGFNIALKTQAFHLGLNHSPEARAKMSAAKRGKPSTNLGKKASPETREKLRISHLGKIPPNRGKKASPEAIEKNRAARLGKPSPRRGAKLSEETKEKLRIANTGKKQSEETVRKRAEANRGKKRSPLAIEKTRLAHLGKKMSAETCENMRRSALGNRSHAKTYIVTSPEGREYRVHGMAEFCREHNLSADVLREVAKGKYKQHKGWTARYPETSTE